MAAAGLLANDADADGDGDALNALLVTTPAHGSLTLNPEGSFTYAPDVDFYGTDTFTYRAADTAAGDPTTVTVAVVGTPDRLGLTPHAPKLMPVPRSGSLPAGDSVSSLLGASLSGPTPRQCWSARFEAVG